MQTWSISELEKVLANNGTSHFDSMLQRYEKVGQVVIYINCSSSQINCNCAVASSCRQCVLCICCRLIIDYCWRVGRKRGSSNCVIKNGNYNYLLNFWLYLAYNCVRRLWVQHHVLRVPANKYLINSLQSCKRGVISVLL
jgi:hypothetical protein